MLRIQGALMQPGRPPIPQEETCPIPENLLGQLYRANSHGLDGLIATVPARTRAMLALYCHRRTHLQSIGLAVAASCEQHDLEKIGGHAGRGLFEEARAAPEGGGVSPHGEGK